MFIISVLNVKGGCGKTTVATHLAARYAAEGHAVVLGDLDRQQNALAWAARRPPELPVVEATELDIDGLVLPFSEGRMVIDAPAGLKRKALEVLIRASDVLVVPVLPSAFDEGGVERFLKLAMEAPPLRKGRRALLLVGNRVHPRTVAATRLASFLGSLGHPHVATLTDAQQYVTAAQSGVTLFDLPVRRLPALRAEWAPLLKQLDELAQAAAAPPDQESVRDTA